VDGNNRDLLLLSVLLLKFGSDVVDGSLGSTIGPNRERDIRNRRDRGGEGGRDDELLLGLGGSEEQVVERLEEDEGSEGVDAEIVFKVFSRGGYHGLGTRDP